MDFIYSPTSLQSEDSTLYSDGSTMPSSQQTPNTNTPTATEEENTNDERVYAKRRHRDIETQRRKAEHRHMEELALLITHWSDAQPPKLSQLGVLKRSADLIGMINQRDQHLTLLPSYLTQDETNFLTTEASNAFLFVTTIESSLFRVIHVTDSIHRILHLTPEQWLGQNLLCLMHPEDIPQVQRQLMLLIQQKNKTNPIACRLRQENGSYLSVTIDGMIKKLDQTFQSVASGEQEYSAFVGVCHSPLKNQYNQTNMSLYKDTQSLILSCRCSPEDWKIFLVDRSVSTVPSASFDVFRNRSILEFIHHNDQPHVHQALLESTVTHQEQLVTCHLLYSPTEIIPMALQIKPFVAPSSTRTDFIELTFTHMNNELEIY